MTRPVAPEIEALISQFFDFPTQDQYEDQLRSVSEEMGRCVIFISDLPSHLSEALSSGA